MKVKTYSYEDLGKARKDGAKDGYDVAILLFVWALNDVEDMPSERIQNILDFIEEKSEFIRGKEVTFADVQKMIKEEKNICVDFDRERIR